MKRLGHVVLVALVMQFTGIAGLCVPAQTEAAHGCCTPEENRPVSPQRSMPECCFVATFHERGSIGQTQSTSENVAPKLLAAERAPVQPAVYQPSNIYRHHVTHPVSPPISPLRQSCLLLI